MRSRALGSSSLLASALLVLLLGCREETESPTAPEPQPAITSGSSRLRWPVVFTFARWPRAVPCAVTLGDQAYCWGDNLFGSLGDGTEEARLAPVPVGGRLNFRQLDVGLEHTCGVTLSNSAWCWGDNSFGELGKGPPQLGSGTKNNSLSPVKVAGQK